MPLGIALVVLAVASLSIVAAPFRLETDDLSYLGLASRYAAGVGLTAAGQTPATGTHFPPGWPLILSWFFDAGLGLPAVTWCASAIGAASLAGAAAIWTWIFARRTGPAWGALSALWGALAFPTLLVGTSASADGLAALMVAVLALLTLPEGPAAALPAPRRAVALGLAMAVLALLRTQLLFLWPLALWHARGLLTRRQRAVALFIATGLTVAVTSLGTMGAPGTSYAALTRIAWRGGLSSLGADTLRSNLSDHVWSGIAMLADSPLSYSGMVARIAGRLGIGLITVVVCLTLGWVALRERRHGLPVLAAAPAALALPFLVGYPYPMSARLLVPAAPLVGYLAVAGLRRAFIRMPRVGQALGAAWLLLGVAWWAHLAPTYRAVQYGALSDARRVVDDLRRHGAWAAPVCAQAPEILWAAAPDARACRLMATSEYLIAPAKRYAAVRMRLDSIGARCAVDITRLESEGNEDLPLASWGFRLSLRTASFSTWCRS
jgi:hypothetical protein